MQYRFAPAMISKRFSRYYDFFVDALFVGKRLQAKTLKRINLKENDTFLDVGCGTGTLAIMVKQTFPKSFVSATDPDDSILGVARDKAKKAELEIAFSQSNGEAMPIKSGTQEIVVSSLAFHHMPREIKIKTLAEIRRVLKSKGRFYLVDIGKPKNVLWRVLCGIEAIVERKEYIKDNLGGYIPNLLRDSGFIIQKTYEPYMGIYTWECVLDGSKAT